MDTVRAFYPRRRDAMGQVSVPVPVILVNGLDPTKELRFDAKRAPAFSTAASR